jgi:hypothetical protein
MLFRIDRRRFASRADRNDRIRAFGDVPVDQAALGLKVECAVFAHR